MIFTVTNALQYDQRMIRICTSLAAAGHEVTLVGIKDAKPLQAKPFGQKRLTMWFKKGPFFYMEYDIRLFCWLLFTKCDLICAIDLDTIIPVWLASKLKRTKRLYDAHEYFSQQKEIVSRPRVYRVWHWIEKTFVPKFQYGYTVSHSIAKAFKKMYGVNYGVIRNMPLLSTTTMPAPLQKKEKTVVYRGAINEARGFESLIPAMKNVDAPLLLYGDGNFLQQVKALIAMNDLSHKVLLKGKLLPAELDTVTRQAYIGINLVEHVGLNQYYSLANKFFDHIHNDLPQVTMNFPEYKKINDAYEVAVLIDNLDMDSIVTAVNSLLGDDELYERLQKNCLVAKEVLNWQNEEKILIQFYSEILK